MNRARIIASAVTAAVALLLMVLLLSVHLSIDDLPWPPQPKTTELVEADDEFVDLFDPAPVSKNPSPAYNPTKETHASKAAQAEGADLMSSGDVGPADRTVTSAKESPLKKTTKEQPTKTGADRENELRDKARREARQGIADAFRQSEAKDNTDARGIGPGDSGSPDGAPSNLNGTGSGSVGGGWIMPRYAKVSSHQTGSIELRAIVDSTGAVSSVELIGGKAPASGDPSLVARCIAEVRRHRFTRTDADAPERSIARIIYTFK